MSWFSSFSPFKKSENLQAEKTSFSEQNIALLQKELGRYSILELVGMGGMGHVYKAYDNELHRIVAMKIMIHSISETNQKRFIREAKAIAKLQHPNIITIYDIGCNNEVPFFIMEFLEGSTLKDTLLSLSFEHTIKIMIDIVKAIDYVHAKGIIHRDLKTSNVILDKNNCPKIIDFGLAKTEKDSFLTKEGTILGTLAFMAPEQIEGNQVVDNRSDIYAFGGMLFEILTKKPPFTADSSSHLIYRILHEKPCFPNTFAQKIPSHLRNICLKALSKDKKLRYQTAKEMLEDLILFSSTPSPVKISKKQSKKARWISLFIILFAIGIYIFTKPYTSLKTSIKLNIRHKPPSSSPYKVFFTDKKNAITYFIFDGATIKPGKYYLSIESPGYTFAPKMITIPYNKQIFSIEEKLQAKHRSLVINFFDKQKKVLVPEKLTVNGKKMIFGNSFPTNTVLQVVAKFKKDLPLKRSITIPSGEGIFVKKIYRNEKHK